MSQYLFMMLMICKHLSGTLHNIKPISNFTKVIKMEEEEQGQTDQNISHDLRCRLTSNIIYASYHVVKPSYNKYLNVIRVKKNVALRVPYITKKKSGCHEYSKFINIYCSRLILIKQYLAPNNHFKII